MYLTSKPFFFFVPFLGRLKMVGILKSYRSYEVCILFTSLKTESSSKFSWKVKGREVPSLTFKPGGTTYVTKVICVSKFMKIILWGTIYSNLAENSLGFHYFE